MSSIRDPAYITDTGQTMMTAGGDITYTKAVLYGQDISNLHTDQIKALTTIGNPLRETQMGVSGKKNTDGHTTVILEATFQNSNLKADLPYTAVGFFAKKDAKEKLVAVAVANKGAYLAATSPDGVATDALDLKLAITIGDTANVTAMIDPAGSVTPAMLNGAIDKATQDLTAKIDTKADNDATQKALNKKADKDAVEASLATKADKADVAKQVKTVTDLANTKADQSALDITNKAVATKANASDVYTKKQLDDAFASRDSTIATKADKATVDAEIGKIDFTPYAKTADVDKQIKTVTDLANTKVDATYSYSKAELDKKLLTVTTTADGKVGADQVAKMIAGKADKEAVNKQLSDLTNEVKANKDQATQDLTAKIDTKADNDATQKALNKKADKDAVEASLATKADKADVAKQVKTVTDLANTKADQSALDITNKAVATKANASDVYTKKQLDDAFASRDSTIATKADKATVDAEIGKIDFTPYAKTADVDNKIKTVTDLANTKADTATVNSQVADAKNAATKAQTTADNANTNANGRLSLNGGTMGGTAQISFADSGTWGTSNKPAGKRGGLRWDGQSDSAEIYADEDGSDNLDLVFQIGDDGSNHFSFRNQVGAEVAAIQSNGHYTGTIDWGNVNGRPDVATHADVATLQNLVNQQAQTIQGLTTRLTNAENEINYIKANYIEGKRFSKSQEAQAEAWEKENSQRLAFMTDK